MYSFCTSVQQSTLLRFTMLTIGPVNPLFTGSHVAIDSIECETLNITIDRPGCSNLSTDDLEIYL